MVVNGEGEYLHEDWLSSHDNGGIKFTEDPTKGFAFEHIENAEKMVLHLGQEDHKIQPVNYAEQ